MPAGGASADTRRVRGASCGCSPCGSQRKWPLRAQESRRPALRGACPPPTPAGPGRAGSLVLLCLWLHCSLPLGAPAQPPTLPGASQPSPCLPQTPARTGPGPSPGPGPSVRRSVRGAGALAEGTAWARPGARLGVSPGPPAGACGCACGCARLPGRPLPRPALRARRWAGARRCGQAGPGQARKGDTACGPEGLGSPRQVRPQPPGGGAGLGFPRWCWGPAGASTVGRPRPGSQAATEMSFCCPNKAALSRALIWGHGETGHRDPAGASRSACAGTPSPGKAVRGCRKGWGGGGEPCCPPPAGLRPAPPGHTAAHQISAR